MASIQLAALWDDASNRYHEISGKRIDDLPRPQTTEELMQMVAIQNEQYKGFQDKKSSLFTVLKAIAVPIELVGNIAAGAASTAVPASSMCFGAALVLINAAKGVSATLAAIDQLLSELKDITARLTIYQRIALSQEMSEKITEILTIMIEIFARSTKIIEQGALYRLKSLGRNSLLGSDTKSQQLLARLDRMTQNEVRLVGAETLVETKRTEETVHAVRHAMDEQTEQLSKLALSASETSAGIDQILGTLEEARLESVMDNKHLKMVKEFLRPSVAAEDHFDEIKREHVPESGNWIYSEKQFQAWAKLGAPLLWVTGIPGSGKSFLAYSIITYLRGHSTSMEDDTAQMSVGYYFFRDTSDQTRSFEQALRDIAFQIALGDQSYAMHLSNVAPTSADIASIRSAWQKLFADYFICGESTVNPAFILFDGVDEAFQEDLNVFLSLLNDIQEASTRSKLYVVLLGRPQIGTQIWEQLAGDIPTIQIDWTKNRDDIAQYVELSISKSRSLNRIHRNLKEHIKATLLAKADGMFMWVKLMIGELSSKSRESTIKAALERAPKGLNEMLRHILRSFSATLSDEDAADLNHMLAWVAFAKRPLSLAEINALLQAMSPEGDSPLDLERKLRIQYASVFTLSREDNLLTTDLRAPRSVLGERQDYAKDDRPYIESGDTEYDIEFNSDQNTTTVSLSHASIYAFFRSLESTMLTAPGEYRPDVGVNMEDARLNMAKFCIALQIKYNDESGPKYSYKLHDYAASYWKEHLDDVNMLTIGQKDKIDVGESIVKLMREESFLPLWCLVRASSFFTIQTAQSLLKWMADSDVLSQLPEDSVNWIKCKKSNPIEVFEPVMVFLSAQWLQRGLIFKWHAIACVTIVSTYLRRKAGKSDDEDCSPSADDVRYVAEWSKLERTAEWHFCVGRALRRLDNSDAALEMFQKSLWLDPDMWPSRVQIGKIFHSQTQFQDALDSYQLALRLAEADHQLGGGKKNLALSKIYKRMGDCYVSLSDRCTSYCDLAHKVRTLKFASVSYGNGFLVNTRDYRCIGERLEILYRFANPSFNGLEPRATGEGRDAVNYKIPHKHQCFEEMLNLLHLLDSDTEDIMTSLERMLLEYCYADEDIHEKIAIAAVSTGQLGWLQEKYRAAVSMAERHSRPKNSAYLVLSLARLYAFYGNDEAKAIQIWDAARLGRARQWASNDFGRYCMRKALEDTANASQPIARLERTWAQRRQFEYVHNGCSASTSETALYLTAWYHRNGEDERAYGAILPHLNIGITHFDDGGSQNEYDGSWILIRALIALGDDKNAIALLHALRKYREDAGTAVLENSGQDDSGLEDDDDSVLISKGGWGCDGICRNIWDYCDGMTICRYCSLDFCRRCLELLLKGELPAKICGKDHSFLTVPYLRRDQLFKKGELLVDGEIMPLSEWKEQFKKQYRL